MKKIIIIGLMLCIGLATKAQELVRANFKLANYKTGIQEVELTFKSFMIVINAEGEIFSIESLKGGRSNPWNDFDDHLLDGRTKLGNLDIIYYDNFSGGRSGKIKSVDGIHFDYYTEYDIHDKKDRIKSIGTIVIKYNNTFDIHDIKGTLKSIGNIDIRYNNVFDSHEIKGTIKSIGPVKISWYNKFDAEDLRGRIKSIKGNTPTLYVTRLLTRRDR